MLERNPTWWGEPPAFGRIVVKAVENTTALEANLLSGEVDMIEGSLGLSLDQALAFERRNGDRFRVVYKPGLVYEHLEPMLDNPALADKRVRQALLHGLDREAIYAEELPALPLFFRADAHVWPRWLEGVEPTGHQAPTTLWVERWRVAGGG